MSVTAEIREWVVQRFADGLQEEHELLVMCDRIDARAELLDGFCERLEGAAKERADITILGVGYTALPVDADGAPIRVGDVMGDRLRLAFAPKKVKMLMLEGDEWLLNFGSGWCSIKNHEWYHHHAPTPEDVLREFAEKVMDSQIPGVHPTYEEAIAEYAAKLRLAESE